MKLWALTLGLSLAAPAWGAAKPPPAPLADTADQPAAAAEPPDDDAQILRRALTAAGVATAAASAGTLVWGLGAYFGTQAIYNADNNAPEAVLFIAWAIAPLLPAALVFASLLLTNTWIDATAGAVATLLGGGIGVGASVLTFFTAFLFLPDAPTWSIIIGVPAAFTVASAATGATTASLLTSVAMLE